MTPNQLATSLAQIITLPDGLPLLWPGNSEGDSPLSVVTLPIDYIKDLEPQRKGRNYIRPASLIWGVYHTLTGVSEEKDALYDLIKAFWGYAGSRAYYRNVDGLTVRDLYLLVPFKNVWVGIKISNIVNT